MIAAPDSAAMQARREDLSVIDNQNIAAPQQLGQVADGAVLIKRLRMRVHDK